MFSGTWKLCCVLIPASNSKDCFPLKWMREVMAEDLFLLPHFSYLFLTFCPFAVSFFTFQKQLVFCENKLCYLLLSAEETNGLVGEMSRTIRSTGAAYSQPKKYILRKLLSAEIMGCHGRRSWFVFCSLCCWSIRACPWGGKGRPGHRYANGLLLVGGKKGKWIFIAFFKCSVYPLSLKGYISVMNQERNSKFKRKKIEELREIASVSVLSKAWLPGLVARVNPPHLPVNICDFAR